MVFPFFRGRKSGRIGDIRVWTQRDDVDGYTTYRHASDKHDPSQQGLLLHINRGDDGRCWIHMSVRTGFVSYAVALEKNPMRLVLNADGRRSEWPCGVRYLADNSRQIHWFETFLPTDEKTREVLKDCSKARVALIRFSGESKFDFEIKAWNKRLIGEMLAAYEMLKPKVRESRAGKTPPGSTAPSAAGVICFGPFRLLLEDGSITDMGGTIQIPRGVAIGGLKVAGHTLESGTDDTYILTLPDGSKRIAKYEDGRWFESKA